MQVIYPAHQFGGFHRGDVEIDDQTLLTTACEHAMQLHILARVNLLMRHVRGHENEVARLSLCHEFEAITPT